jgi:hypothetical protein
VAIKGALVAAYAVGAVLMAGGLTACGSSDQIQPTAGGAASFSPSPLAPTDEPAAVPTVPDAFAAACGQPGSDVTVTDLPVTVSHAQCDLTGVIVHYGLSSITVPSSGEVGGDGDGPVDGSDLVVDVDGLSGDVTIAVAPS